MAYSVKRRWLMQGGALALFSGGIALIAILKHNQFDPAVIALVLVLVSMATCGMAMRAYSYMDEVQLQRQLTNWLWGSMIGFMAMLPVAMFLGRRLDASIQFFFHRPGTPALYFALGAMLPLVLQSAGCFALQLLGKLPHGSNT